MKIRMTESQYDLLRNHLFQGDSNESVAIALCGHNDDCTSVCFHKLLLIPNDECLVRTEKLVQWKTELIIPFLEEAMSKDLTIVKLHSHPSGYEQFSTTDDISDQELFKSISGWINSEVYFGSIVMLPDGKMFGRSISSLSEFGEIESIAVIGDSLQFFYSGQHKLEEFQLRSVQAFGEGTMNQLSQMKVCVVGCSGTGSVLIEQLVRLGVGELLLYDNDTIEKKNLNRILNSTAEDVGKKKVEVLKNAIENFGLKTKIVACCENICESETFLQKVSSCDLIIGCTDSVDSRHFMNHSATFYLLPFIDLGVKLSADGVGNVSQVCGTINYLQPGGDSLLGRGLYNSEELRSAMLFRQNKSEYNEQLKHGYITNMDVESPAVISINMTIASLAVNELLARIHNFRYDDNSGFATTRISLSDSYFQFENEGEKDHYLAKFVGRGNMNPRLNMPGL